MSALLVVLLGEFSYGFNNKIRNKTGLPWAGVWGPGEWAEPSAGGKERGAALPCPWAVGTERAMAASEAETRNTGQPQDWPPRMKESAASAFA